MRSPLIAIAAYEREHGIPPNYINLSMSVHLFMHRTLRLTWPLLNSNIFSAARKEVPMVHGRSSSAENFPSSGFTRPSEVNYPIRTSEMFGTRIIAAEKEWVSSLFTLMFTEEARTR